MVTSGWVGAGAADLKAVQDDTMAIVRDCGRHFLNVAPDFDALARTQHVVECLNSDISELRADMVLLEDRAQLDRDAAAIVLD